MVARLPAVPADTFKLRLLDAVRRCNDTGSVVLETLDPAVKVLLLPLHEAARPQAGGSADVNAALRALETSGRTWSSVTWSALLDARPPFAPNATQWAGEFAHRFEGDAGLVFFVDVEALAVAVSHAAEGAGLSARIDDDAMVVRVSDGRFVAHVGTSALLAEALWTARGPASVVSKRAQALSTELRSFLSTLKGLERRFPALQFDLRDDVVHVRSQHAVQSVDYRRTAVAMRSTGLPTDAWLKRVQLEDLVEGSGDPLVLVRSPAYMKAYPDALATATSSYALVAVREHDGRTIAVKRNASDDVDRFVHYQDEAARQLPFFAFSGHGFVVEQAQKGGAVRAACIVGDKAASVAVHDTLIRGLLEKLMPFGEHVLVRSYSENTAWFTSPKASSALMEEVRRRARELEVDLFGDTSDALTIERVVRVPPVGHGHFDLAPVAEQYFSMRDQAATRSDVGRGHGDYLRGLCFQLLGMPTEAAAHLERAVRVSSNDGEMNLALGRALTDTNDHARAVVFLRRATTSLDAHAEAHNALGVALKRTGDPVQARLSFETAVKLAPDEAVFLVNFGRSCCEQQMFHEARSALERALRLDPDIPEAHAALAVVFHRIGERERALRHAKEALSDPARDEAVAELLALISQTDPKRD